MDYYTVISSDLYQLSCVAVSQLDQLEKSEIKDDDEFLVSEKTPDEPELSTRTGYMSKFVTFKDVKQKIVQDMDIDDMSAQVQSFSATYVKKDDIGDCTLVLDSVPSPYIISAMRFENGAPVECSGYSLSDVLSDVLTSVSYTNLSVQDLSVEEFLAEQAEIGSLSVEELNNPFIDRLAEAVPASADASNPLVDREYMLSVVQRKEPSFRGQLGGWNDLTNYENYLPDETGNKKPNENDYVVISSVEDYNHGH